MRALLKYLPIAGVVFAISLCSCSSSDEPKMISDNGEIVRLTSTVRSRADQDYQSTSLYAGVKVGVFVTDGNSLIENGNNNMHAVASNNELTTSSPMHYPKGIASSINIYAYAPYAEGTALNTDRSFTVAADQSTAAGYVASDLVYASKKNVAKSANAVALAFDHKLSQLQISIENEAGADLSNAAVAICGTKLSTTFNPSTGELGMAEGAVTDITAISALGNGAEAYAIVIPQSVSAGTELVKITTADRTYSATLGMAVSFEAGKAYRFTMTIEEDIVDLKLGPTSINGWGTPNDIGTSNLEEVAKEDDNGSTVDPEPTTPDKIYAEFGGTEAKASYDVNTNTYSWTSYETNSMTCFKFEKGELANYKNLNFKFSNSKGCTLKFNFVFFGGNVSSDTNKSYEEKITYEIDMATEWADALKDHTLADVIEIRICSQVDKGSCVIKASDMYISK